MLIDAFEPQGVTRLAVDSIFMMPHLGVLAQLNEEAATEVFEHDCLIELGTCVAPLNTGKPGITCFEYSYSVDGKTVSGKVGDQEMKLEPLAHGKTATIHLEPHRSIDLGAGRGKPLDATVHGGVVGLVLDGRGRPIVIPKENRQVHLNNSVAALDAYPGAQAARR
jgi:hypothetical protein